MRMLLLMLSLLMLTSGCTWLTQETITVPVKVPIVCEERDIESIETLPIEWQIGRNEKGDNIVGLDGENYANLSINIGRATTHIIERKEYSTYLERCIERFNNSE